MSHEAESPTRLDRNVRRFGAVLIAGGGLVALDGMLSLDFSQFGTGISASGIGMLFRLNTPGPIPERSTEQMQEQA